MSNYYSIPIVFCYLYYNIYTLFTIGPRSVKYVPLFLKILLSKQFGSLSFALHLSIALLPCCFFYVLPSISHLSAHPAQTNEKLQSIGIRHTSRNGLALKVTNNKTIKLTRPFSPVSLISLPLAAASAPRQKTALFSGQSLCWTTRTTMLQEKKKQNDR